MIKSFQQDVDGGAVREHESGDDAEEDETSRPRRVRNCRRRNGAPNAHIHEENQALILFTRNYEIVIFKRQYY